VSRAPSCTDGCEACLPKAPPSAPGTPYVDHGEDDGSSCSSADLQYSITTDKAIEGSGIARVYYKTLCDCVRRTRRRRPWHAHTRARARMPPCPHLTALIHKHEHPASRTPHAHLTPLTHPSHGGMRMPPCPHLTASTHTSTSTPHPAPLTHPSRTLCRLVDPLRTQEEACDADSACVAYVDNYTQEPPYCNLKSAESGIHDARAEKNYHGKPGASTVAPTKGAK